MKRQDWKLRSEFQAQFYPTPLGQLTSRLVMSWSAQYRLDSPVILAERHIWNTPGSLLTCASWFCVESGAGMLVDISTQMSGLVMTWCQFLQFRNNLSLCRWITWTPSARNITANQVPTSGLSFLALLGLVGKYFNYTLLSKCNNFSLF